MRLDRSALIAAAEAVPGGYLINQDDAHLWFGVRGRTCRVTVAHYSNRAMPYLDARAHHRNEIALVKAVVDEIARQSGETE